MPNRKGSSRVPRILIASDQNHALQDLETFLDRHGYSVVRLYAGTGVLERARSMRPDVILLDGGLSDRNPMELSRALRDDPLVGVSTPVVLLVTGQPTSRDHQAALRVGIWELLVRTLPSNELLLKLDAYVAFKMEADRTSAGDLLDGTTGLYTTQGLAHRARELIFQAAQHNVAAACVVFAPAPALETDATGAEQQWIAEPVGRLARVLKADGRRSDAIGRVGPEEFALVAAGTDAGGAVKLAERIRRAVRAGETTTGGAAPGFELRAGYEAVGNVRYAPVDSMDLLARAVRALQLAKAGGQWIRGMPGTEG